MSPIPRAKDAPPPVATPSAKTPQPSPPQKNPTKAGSGFGSDVGHLPDVKPLPAPPPVPATPPAIPTASLQTDAAHDDERYIEKLNALLADPRFKQLAGDVPAFTLYLNDHHEAIDPLIEQLARDRDEEAFESRKWEIDRWLAKHGNTDAERIVVALQGSSELKSLSKREQLYLIYHADTPGETHIDFDDVCKLTLPFQDRKLRSIVAEGLFNLAVEIEEQPEDDRSNSYGRARAFALEAVNAMSDDQTGLGEMISRKPALAAAAFTRTLSSENMKFPGWLSNARSQLLAALNSQPSSEATSAVVGIIFAMTSPRDVAAAKPQLARNLAIALARETYPDPGDAGKAVAEAKRLEGLMLDCTELMFGGSLDRKVNALAALRADTSITAKILSDDDGDQAENPVVAKAIAQLLVPADAPNRMEVIARFFKILQEDQGQQLVFGTRIGQVEDNVPGAAKAAALQLIFTHPSITAETLSQTDDPWVNPAIVEPIAQQLTANFRNDEPTVLAGATLDNMVGKAMGMPPNLPAEMSEEEALKQIEAGTLSVYSPQNNYRTIKDYETHENYQSIKKIADQLRRVGGQNPSVTVLSVVFSGMDRGPRPRGPFPGGPIQLPLFRVQTAAGDKFVDNLGFLYNNFDDWKKHNRLPPGLVIFPENGHLQTGQDESLILGHLTNPSQTVGELVDSLALVGGIVAGGLVILGTGGLAAAAMLGTAAWGTYRSANELHFNYTHGDPLSSSEKRALWLSFAANATGVVPGAAELVLARYIAKGSQIGRGLALALGAAGTLATVANGAALLNDVVELFQKWERMTTEDRISGILNIAYAGMIGGVGARHAIKFFHPVKAAAAVLARSRQARLERLESQLNQLTAKLKTAPPEQIARINEDIDKVHTAIDGATKISPAEKRLLDRLDPPATKFDPDSFWPNPKAPDGPVRSKHDRIAHAIGGLVARARAAANLLRKGAPDETYKTLYDKTSPEHRKFLPAPGSFKVDDNTVALAEFVGGLEKLIADIHAHPYGYDRRSPWNDLILGLRHGTDALVGLLEVADRDALVAIEAIAQSCGSPGGYYADAVPSKLTMKQAAELDVRVAEVYLAVYGQGPEGRALAAKGHISMTGFDFSEKTGVLARYRTAAKACEEAWLHRKDLDRRWVGAEKTYRLSKQFDAAAAELRRQQELGVVTLQALKQYEKASKALESALSKHVEAPPGFYDRSPASVQKLAALEDEALKALRELRAYEAEVHDQSTDPVTHTLNMLRQYPGVFSLFGEITADKELVGQALGAGKWDVSNPKFKRWLELLVANKMKAAIVLHTDWGHPGLDEAGRAAAVQMAYENLPKIMEVFGQEKYRDLVVIFAHTGIGRYVRPNAKLVEVSVIDHATGQRVTRHVPEHIAMIYQVAEKVPNAKFDISWNDVTQAYVDNPPLRTALVDFIIDNQDRILFGSDTVKPVNSGHYNQALNTGAPIFAEIARRDPEALWKLLRGNSEKVLNDGAASVADWAHKNLTDPKALAAMDERNKVLAEQRARMFGNARVNFDLWVAKFNAQGSPTPSNNPGFFPGFFMSHPDAHDHDPPLEGANPAYGPLGRGTPGGYANEPPKANPIAKKAVRDNKIAATAITAGAGTAGAAAMDHVGGDADALAFMGRGAAIAIRALYTERLRLDWEEIFEEGHVTQENTDRFVRGIVKAADALNLSPDQLADIGAAQQQLLANYKYLAEERPLSSYQTIGGTIEEAKVQRFNAIMAKIGEFQIAVDRALGFQASSINPFDARTASGKAYRSIMLATYLVNDVAAVEWLTSGRLNLSAVTTPEGAAEAAYHILFLLGNAGKTAETIAGWSGGVSGRLNEASRIFKEVQKYSNWALISGGAVWSSTDFAKVLTDFSAGGMTGQAGLDTVKGLLDLAFAYGMYRMTTFEAIKASGGATPHGRNLAWAAAAVGWALVMREIIRELEEKNKPSKKPGNGAPAAVPTKTPAVAAH